MKLNDFEKFMSSYIVVEEFREYWAERVIEEGKSQVYHEIREEVEDIEEEHDVENLADQLMYMLELTDLDDFESKIN